ncbi:MAG: DUF3800 domain-containing protein [bacterium]|nr:DUF3800 domain-containing protein [bacterium]
MYAFIDESGDHNIDLSKSDNVYNIFVLGTVLIDKNAYKTLDREFKTFKKEFFGGDDFIIHTKELTRGNIPRSDPRNKIMGNPDKRHQFYDWINLFLTRAPISAFFSIINKTPFSAKYSSPFDLYGMSFENALNRILHYGTGNNIEIYPERRGSVLDKQMEAEFAKISIAGTRFHSAEEIKRRIQKLEFKSKKENISGLQIADLLVSPVGRHFLGVRPKPPGNEVRYEIVRKKLAGNEKTCLSIFP